MAAMKIRKLIFSAKLEQIEKQNQNIFIFHCSANASQWRFLKNFLFFYGQRVLANKTSELRALEGATKELFPPVRPSLTVGPLLNYQARSTDSGSAPNVARPKGAETINSPEAGERASLLRGYTYFQSTSFKKNRSTTNNNQTASVKNKPPRPRLPSVSLLRRPRLLLDDRSHANGRPKGGGDYYIKDGGPRLLFDRRRDVRSGEFMVPVKKKEVRRPTLGPSDSEAASSLGQVIRPRASAAPVFATKKPVPLAGPKRSPRLARVLPRLYAPAKIAAGSRASEGATLGPGTGSHTTALSQKSLNKKFRPKGCLFFFDTRSNTLFETHQKKPVASAGQRIVSADVGGTSVASRGQRSGLELVNKTLRALEFNNNLILLYGQMNSTVVNHVDIKETLILDAQTTYQQLFLSMHSLSIGLNFCLHQKIDEFFCVQETNR